MRRLTGMLRRRVSAPLELTSGDRRDPGGAPSLGTLAAEIGAVAAYVDRLRRAVAALRPASMRDESLPALRADLLRVREDNDAAVEAIVVAAEAVIDYRGPAEGYRDLVEARLTAILEACSFHDIAGQRLARAEAALDGIGERLARFVAAAGIADGEGSYHRRAVAHEVRREVLLVEGPDRDGGASQGAVDRVFG